MAEKPNPINLFLIFLKIASLTLGGGAVMLGFMEDEFSNRRKWLSRQEVADIFALVNSLPGVIGINSSVIIGKKLAGLPGAVASALGVLFPSFFIIYFLSEVVVRMRGMAVTGFAFLAVRSGAAALILMAMLRLFRNAMKSWREWFIAVSAFVELQIIGIPALWVVLISAVWGLLLFWRES